MSKPLFLGLDLSTQQLKPLFLDENAVVVNDFAISYDRDLPQHGTRNGATQGLSDGQVTSPVAMWVEAIDPILQHMRDAGVDFGQIRAISRAGQVLHSHALTSLNPSKTSLSQLHPDGFSIHHAYGGGSGELMLGKRYA